MKEFYYSWFARVVYRYANVLLTGLLLISALVSLGEITKGWINVIPFLIHVILIYVLNRFYFNIYKHFPFKIFADNEKMICEDFMNQRKRLEIYHADITSLEGGMFSGNPLKPIYITTKDGNKIGINQHLKDFNGLLTIILSNIPQELYSGLLNKIKDMEPSKRENKKARKKRASNKKRK